MGAKEWVRIRSVIRDFCVGGEYSSDASPCASVAVRAATSYKPADDRYVVKLDAPVSADELEVAVLAANLTPVGVKRVKDVRACANCAAVEPEAGAYPKCDSCKCTWYCGAECQRVHWKATHKRECKEIQARGTLVISPAVAAETAAQHSVSLEALRQLAAQHPAQRVYDGSEKCAQRVAFEDAAERNMIVKIQVPVESMALALEARVSPSDINAALMVYNQDRSFFFGLTPANSGEHYARLCDLIREHGVLKAKGYFSARINADRSVSIAAYRLLPPAAW